MDIELLIILGIVIFSCLILNFLLVRYSTKLKLVDTPNGRSMHKEQKSRAGGISIFISFILGVYLLKIPIEPFLAVAFFIVFLLGIYDDINGSSSKIKFIWLSISSVFIYKADIFIDSLGNFLGNELMLISFVSLIFTIFAVVGFINAMNLIDGLDGLSAGVAIVILCSYFYLGYIYEDMFLLYITSILICSLVAFLFYNWYPSKLFMGDSGSLTLGFVIAILSIHSVQNEYISPVTVLLLTAVPILDTLIVMTRRIVNGVSPFSPDITHIHHILLRQHYNNVPKISKILILLQIVFVYIGLGFKVRDDLVILICFLLLFILFYYLLTAKPYKKK